jgi:excisionase family DNA binding protein
MKSRTPHIPHFLSMAQVAQAAGVSLRTVSRWIATKDLHAHKLGRKVRVSEEDFLQFIAARRV